MERLHYRSTSLVDIQAELRQADLLAEAQRFHTPTPGASRPRLSIFGLQVFRRRSRR